MSPHVLHNRSPLCVTGPSASELAVANKSEAEATAELQFLASLDADERCAGLDDDQKIRIARQLVFEASRGNTTDDIKGALVGMAQAALPDGTWKCPKVRFGRTNLQMPIITCGGMRMQEAWGNKITSMDQVDPECQANFESIVHRSLALGINHFETAKGYGCSEIQVNSPPQLSCLHTHCAFTAVQPGTSRGALW